MLWLPNPWPLTQFITDNWSCFCKKSKSLKQVPVPIFSSIS